MPMTINRRFAIMAAFAVVFGLAAWLLHRGLTGYDALRAGFMTDCIKQAAGAPFNPSNCSEMIDAALPEPSSTSRYMALVVAVLAAVAGGGAFIPGIISPGRAPRAPQLPANSPPSSLGIS